MSTNEEGALVPVVLLLGVVSVSVSVVGVVSVSVLVSARDAVVPTVRSSPPAPALAPSLVVA